MRHSELLELEEERKEYFAKQKKQQQGKSEQKDDKKSSGGWFSGKKKEKADVQEKETDAKDSAKTKTPVLDIDYVPVDFDAYTIRDLSQGLGIEDFERETLNKSIS